MTSRNVEGISQKREAPGVSRTRGHRKVVISTSHKKRNTRKERRQKPKLDPKRWMAWLGVISGVLTALKLPHEIIKLIIPH